MQQAGMQSSRTGTWSLAWLEHDALAYSARIAVAATLSLLAARILRMPEAYWAPVTTLMVIQSSVGAALTASLRRFAGTALGVATGALLATYFGPNALAFGAGIFLLGILCALMSRANPRVSQYFDRTAYLYAGNALAIVMLIVRYNSAWVVALHRFIEVSIGIAVGLALTLLWPERESAKGHNLLK